MSTATHGSGIRQQCLSATARRFRVITPSGEAAEVTEDDPELLAAMQVSLGLLGVITEVEFQAREAFALAKRIEFWPASSLNDKDRAVPAGIDRLDRPYRIYPDPDFQGEIVMRELEYRRRSPSTIGSSASGNAWTRPALSWALT